MMIPFRCLGSPLESPSFCFKPPPPGDTAPTSCPSSHQSLRQPRPDSVGCSSSEASLATRVECIRATALAHQFQPNRALVPKEGESEREQMGSREEVREDPGVRMGEGINQRHRPTSMIQTRTGIDQSIVRKTWISLPSTSREKR